MTLRTPVATLLIGLLLGCGQTLGQPEEILSGDLAARVMRGVLMVSTLAAEVAHNTAEPPGPGGCPSSSQDGDDLRLDYSTGCAPESGITADVVGGVVRLTVAGGMGVFVGDVQAFGFDDLPLTGDLSGDVSRAGSLLGADVDWTGLGWAEGGTDNLVEALVEIEGDDDLFRLSSTSGRFLRGADVEVDFDLEDATVARGALGPCFVPDGGLLRLTRQGATATLEFTPEAASSGEVRATFNGQDPQTVAPCP